MRRSLLFLIAAYFLFGSTARAETFRVAVAAAHGPALRVSVERHVDKQWQPIAILPSYFHMDSFANVIIMRPSRYETNIFPSRYWIRTGLSPPQWLFL